MTGFLPQIDIGRLPAIVEDDLYELVSRRDKMAFVEPSENVAALFGMLGL
jgi:hypothetical protein